MFALANLLLSRATLRSAIHNFKTRESVFRFEPRKASALSSA